MLEMVTKRALAFLLDLLIALLPPVVVGAVLFLMRVSAGDSGALIILAASLLGYFWLVPGVGRGRTPGLSAVGLTLANSVNGSPPGLEAAYVRTLTAAFLIISAVAVARILSSFLFRSVFGQASPSAYEFIILLSPIFTGLFVIPVSIVLSPSSGLHDRLAGVQVSRVSQGIVSSPLRYTTPQLAVLAFSLALTLSFMLVVGAVNVVMKGNLYGRVVGSGFPFHQLQEPGQRTPWMANLRYVHGEPLGRLVRAAVVYRIAPSPRPYSEGNDPKNIPDVGRAMISEQAWATVSIDAVTPLALDNEIRLALSRLAAIEAYQILDEQVPFIYVVITWNWGFGPICYSERTNTTVVFGSSKKRTIGIVAYPLEKLERAVTGGIGASSLFGLRGVCVQTFASYRSPVR